MTSAGPTLRESLLAASLLNAVMMVMALSAFAVPVMAPAIAADLVLDPTLITIYSAILWTASVGTSIGAGRLIARFGPVRVSQICLMVCAVGIAIAARASFMIGSAGLLIGPLLFGLVARNASFGAAFIVLGLVALAGVIALLAPGGNSRP